MDADKINAAVDIAKANEYSGSHDLRVAIHTSFGFEPFDEIVGPTKERGGPAGIILKDGYIIAEWGDRPSGREGYDDWKDHQLISKDWIEMARKTTNTFNIIFDFCTARLYLEKVSNNDLRVIRRISR